MENNHSKKTLVVIGSKVPAEIREAIQKKATAEDRTLSQVVSRLLASHPELKIKRQKVQAIA
jgi:outer membrane protein TolC